MKLTVAFINFSMPTNAVEFKLKTHVEKLSI
jgi:hypothetical protein